MCAVVLSITTTSSSADSSSSSSASASASSCSCPRADVRPRIDRRTRRSSPNESLNDGCRARGHGTIARRPRRLRPPHAVAWSRMPWHRLWAAAALVALVVGGRGAGASHMHVAKHLDWIEPTELVFDTSPPPPRPVRMVARQESTSGGVSSAASSTDQVPLPSPFDSTLGNNFTSPSCPEFFDSFLNNATFQQCHPFSMLLQTSSSFFAAEHSLVRLTQTLDASCHVDYSACSALMASLAAQIRRSSACGADLKLQNPMVEQAYNALLAYDPLYHAACLVDTSGDYCFASAVTNASAPTSGYIYYVPLGVQLPAGTLPACNTCLRNTMAIFAAAASNKNAPLHKDYVAAAQMVDMTCGPLFVQESVAHTSAAAATRPLRPSALLWVGLVGALVVLGSFLV